VNFDIALFSEGNKITLGDGTGDTVNASGSEIAITVGNGDDTVSANFSSYDTIALGIGINDFVNLDNSTQTAQRLELLQRQELRFLKPELAGAWNTLRPGSALRSASQSPMVESDDVANYASRRPGRRVASNAPAMPSASRMILAARSPSSVLIACSRRLVMIRLTQLAGILRPRFQTRSAVQLIVRQRLPCRQRHAAASGELAPAELRPVFGRQVLFDQRAHVIGVASFITSGMTIGCGNGRDQFGPGTG
jgi:hypothetical protein